MRVRSFVVEVVDEVVVAVVVVVVVVEPLAYQGGMSGSLGVR